MTKVVLFRRIAPLLAAVGCLAAAGCGNEVSNDVKVRNNLGEAARQADIGNVQGARKWADDAIKVDPKALSTYVATSSAQQNPRSYLAALLGNEDGRNSIAAIFESVGDYKTCAEYMRDAARKFPNDYEPLAVLVDIQGTMGDEASKRETAAALAAIVEKKFTTPGARTDDQLVDTLAQAYWDAGDAVKGELNYRKAISAYPSKPLAYNGLAYAYAVANVTAKLPEALRLANTALALARKDPEESGQVGLIQDTLGWVHYRMGDYKEALSELHDAVDAVPRQPEIRYHLAMVYLGLHDTAAARVELIHATLLCGDYAEATRELARLKPEDEPKKID